MLVPCDIENPETGAEMNIFPVFRNKKWREDPPGSRD